MSVVSVRKRGRGGARHPAPHQSVAAVDSADDPAEVGPFLPFRRNTKKLPGRAGSTAAHLASGEHSAQHAEMRAEANKKIEKYHHEKVMDAHASADEHQKAAAAREPHMREPAPSHAAAAAHAKSARHEAVEASKLNHQREHDLEHEHERENTEKETGASASDGQAEKRQGLIDRLRSRLGLGKSHDGKEGDPDIIRKGKHKTSDKHDKEPPESAPAPVFVPVPGAAAAAAAPAEIHNEVRGGAGGMGGTGGGGLLGGGGGGALATVLLRTEGGAASQQAPPNQKDQSSEPAADGDDSDVKDADMNAETQPPAAAEGEQGGAGEQLAGGGGDEGDGNATAAADEPKAQEEEAEGISHDDEF